MELGAHLSISKGLEETVNAALIRKCNTFQIFSRSPRMWRKKNFLPSETENFRMLLKKHGLDPVVLHTIYLPNPASSDDSLREKSTQVIIEDLTAAKELGAAYVVIHPGHHMDSGIEKGIENLAKSVNTALSSIKNDVTLLIEMLAGTRTDICSSIEEVREAMDKITENKRCGVCLDTCHTFARGYELNTAKGLEDFLSSFDKKVGLKKIKVIHLNDSKYPAGSRMDRHEGIGKGYIGREGFSRIVNHPVLKDLPFILETPGADRLASDLMNLAAVRELAG